MNRVNEVRFGGECIEGVLYKFEFALCLGFLGCYLGCVGWCIVMDLCFRVRLLSLGAWNMVDL